MPNVDLTGEVEDGGDFAPEFSDGSMISLGCENEEDLELEGMSTSSISSMVTTDSFVGLFFCFLVARESSSSITSSTSLGDAL